MRIFAVIGCVIFFVFPIIYCIRAILGRGGALMKGFWRKCTNLKEDNIAAQKYVLRVYGIKNLIISLMFCAGVICLIYRQWIAGGVLCIGSHVFWGIFEVILLKCKKYQECKAEISDDKRLQDYWNNLKNENLNNVQVPDINMQANNIKEV